MSRFARVDAPGSLVHVIARFVNHEFRLNRAVERRAYLARLATALGRTDWRLCAWALMSNHIHLAMLAGRLPFERFAKSVHIAFAHWLNRAQRRFGPLFAERPTTVHVPIERMGHLVAYLHNNPVRAGVVSAAADSDWTSHRSWLGLVPAPSGLEIAGALAPAGFDATAAGRYAFDSLVRAHAGDPRDPELSGVVLPQRRAAVRGELALPVELQVPVVSDGVTYVNDVLHLGVPATEARWRGDLEHLVRVVAERRRVPREALLSRSRVAEVVRARRVAAVAGVMLLRRSVVEVAAALEVSSAAVSTHLRRATEVMADAARVADVLRRREAGGGVDQRSF